MRNTNKQINILLILSLYNKKKATKHCL